MEFLKKHGITILSVALALVVVALFLTFRLLLTATQELEKTQQSEIVSIALADELRQSSDDLTRMARTYVVTANPLYENQYNRVLDIRNGNAPRPKDYGRVYWDLVTKEGVKPRPDGEAVALKTLMKDAGFTKQEFAKLTESENNSNALVNLEVRAMNAVKGKYPDSTGKYTVMGEPDLKLARDLMHGPKYHTEKAKIMKPIDEFYTLMLSRVEAAVKAAEARLRLAQQLEIVLIVLAALLAAAIAYLARKRAAAQLAERKAAQDKAEAENEKLNNSVISILQTMQSLSQRDLTAKAPVTDDIIGTVSDSVNALTDETSRVLLDVTDVASQVEQASSKVKMQANLVSETAEKERENVLQMTGFLSEAAEQMAQVASLASNSNDSAAKAAMATQDALGTVSNTVNEMQSIRETISQTEKRIKRLGERSQEISGIVGLINTISERTHVLALNASMQAAVAGEAGRGFAVVAEEVQRLAESSRNATEQIETLVKNIQLDTNETINTVNQTIAQVVQGSEQAEKAGQQMQQTREITAELVAQVQQIAEAMHEQQEMSNQLFESVRRIGESTENTARQIGEQNEETNQLQKAAKKLVDSVNVFKLPQKVA